MFDIAHHESRYVFERSRLEELRLRESVRIVFSRDRRSSSREEIKTMRNESIRKSDDPAVFPDGCELEPAPPIDRPIPALAAIRIGQNPLYVRSMLFDKSDAYRDRTALAILRKDIAECHAIQFDKFIPFRPLHEAYELRLIHTRTEAHDTPEIPAPEDTEVELAAVDDFPAVMMLFDEVVRHPGGDRSK